MEIGTVGAVDRLEGAGLEAGLAQVDALIIHPFVEGTAVIEHAVQDDPHVPAVQLLAETGKEIVALFQILHGGDPADIPGRIAVMLFPGLHGELDIVHDDAKVRINMLVILGIVFMTGGGDEDGVQIEHLDAQILQIVQLIQDALQIPAVEAADVRIRGVGVPVLHVLRMADGIIILIVGNIIGGIPVAEPVRENLVLDGALGPGGHMKARLEAKGVGRAVIRHGAVFPGPGTVFVIGDADAVFRFDQETVDDLGIIADNARFIIIEELIRTDADHQGTHRQGLHQQDHAEGAVLRDPQADGDRITGIRLGGEAVDRRFIAIDSGEHVRRN